MFEKENYMNHYCGGMLQFKRFIRKIFNYINLSILCAV